MLIWGLAALLGRGDGSGGPGGHEQAHMEGCLIWSGQEAVAVQQ